MKTPAPITRISSGGESPITAPVDRAGTSITSARGLAGPLMLATALAFAAAPAAAQEVKQPMITVNATGMAAAAPDMANVNLTVQREAKTARAALDANNKAMGDVLAALKKAGIEDKDLQTSGFNVQPRYHYPKSSSGNKPPELVGYIVTNSLTARVRDLANLGAILDQSISLGVNSGGSIQFTNSDPQPIIEQARENAVAQAIAKARTLTEAAGVNLGRILLISEAGRTAPGPRPMARMERMASSDAAVPIAQGENSYSVSVNVQWELLQ